MLSSKTLEQRNNGAIVIVMHPTNNFQRVWSEAASDFDDACEKAEAANPGWNAYLYSPIVPTDSRYQYGILPANPILVEFREAVAAYGAETALEDWLDWLRLPWYDDTTITFPVGSPVPATVTEIAHAHRVLTLLASLPSEVKA